ncbi:MAG: aldehyde dehydrogenase family protein, partial [Propionibacteriaceae bacterium]|nr:aldehyde dehydrogenase family protein [Propionibacteriaceae bacterium]
IEGLAVGVPATHRTQDRTAAITIEPTVGFANTPDSDPAIGVNQAWAAGIRARARSSQLGLETVAAHTVSTREELNTRISTAVAAGAQWGARPAAERAAILHRAGVVLESRRAELMEVAAAEAGKLLDQSDPEVSEAVDFAHFYAERALDLERIDGAVAEPVRLTVVTPPWNFPIAIPTGSTIAALAAGSAVLLKPASPAVRTGACLVEALWEAGVPRDVLQLVKLSERNLGEQLVGDPRVDRVILTGGFETAELFRSFRPDLQLLAETSGKNALIVTPHADYDLAARDAIASAFGHAGQKCSAASLLILVGQAGRSPRLRNQLLDGIRSLVVGYPWDAEAQMGPVITPPDGKLLTGLTSLGAGEHWVLEPRPLDDGGTLWSPGVRWGVQPGSAFHRTEYFGPILGIMHTETLAEAIAIANDVDYGLTAGLHSLDEAEIAHWIATIQAGNLYVNRGITGAIVQRQPFGGWKRSVVGPSAKAGGPNYLLPLVDWRAAPAQEGVAPRHASVRTLLEAARRDLSAAEQAALTRATASDERAWQTEYGITKDVSGLLAERNVVRYCPMPGGVIRLTEDGRVADLVRVAAAALRAGARPDISTGVALPVAVHTALTSIGFVVRSASDTDFASAVQALPDCRIRMVSADPVVGVRRLAEATRSRLGITILGQPVTESGRVEMLGFLREQAIAVTAHRFGTPHPTPLDSPDTYGGSHDNAP